MGESKEVPSNVELRLRLLIGGELPYKWQIYEYPGGKGPPVALPDGKGESSALVVISGLQPGQTRLFTWSVAAVNLGDEQVAEVHAEAFEGDKVVAEMKSSWKVKPPAGKCFVSLSLKGRSQ